MADPTDTTPAQNSPTTTDQSAPKADAPAPASSDTSATTPNPSTDDETLLTPKPDDAKPEGEQGDDAKPEGEKDGDAEPSALFGAPEEGSDYEIAGLPDGVTIDAEALAAVTPLARELNLSNEGLSKLASVYTESVLPGVVAQVQKQATDDLNMQVADLRKGWATDARAMISGGVNAAGETVTPDPVFAGKSLAEVQTISAKAIDQFGGADFRAFLEETGLGNRPEMLRFAFGAGAAISEDMDLPRGGGIAAAPLTREEKYYGKQTAT